MTRTVATAPPAGPRPAGPDPEPAADPTAFAALMSLLVSGHPAVTPGAPAAGPKTGTTTTTAAAAVQPGGPVLAAPGGPPVVAAGSPVTAAPGSTLAGAHPTTTDDGAVPTTAPVAAAPAVAPGAGPATAPSGRPNDPRPNDLRPNDPRPNAKVTSAVPAALETPVAGRPRPEAPEEPTKPVNPTTAAQPGQPDGPAAAPLARSGPDAAAAPSAAPAPTPAAQLLPVLLPFRRSPDGVHELTVRLQPEELGPVQVTISVRDGSVHVHLLADSPASRDALRQALPSLRSEVERAGLATGSFDVSTQSGGSGQTPPWRTPQVAPPKVPPPEPFIVPAPQPAAGPVPRASGPRGLDLML